MDTLDRLAAIRTRIAELDTRACSARAARGRATTTTLSVKRRAVSRDLSGVEEFSRAGGDRESALEEAKHILRRAIKREPSLELKRAYEEALNSPIDKVRP